MAARFVTAIKRQCDAPALVTFGRWSRPLAFGVTSFGFAVFGWLVIVGMADPAHEHVLGRDRIVYHDAAIRWLAGGEWFYAEQVVGTPYDVVEGHVMYPPVALPWLVPGALLPDLLWYLAPLAAIAAIVIHHRPSPWGWAGIAMCLAYPWSAALLLAGNPGLWIAAACALGTIWRPGFAFILAKPSLFPFALLGVRSTGWWVVVGIGAVISLLFWPLTEQWIGVVVNARGTFSGPLYALRDLGWMLVPLVAWWTGREAPLVLRRTAAAGSGL